MFVHAQNVMCENVAEIDAIFASFSSFAEF